MRPVRNLGVYIGLLRRYHIPREFINLNTEERNAHRRDIQDAESRRVV